MDRLTKALIRGFADSNRWHGSRARSLSLVSTSLPQRVLDAKMTFPLKWLGNVR
jgi:hypothetical protein